MLPGTPSLLQVSELAILCGIAPYSDHMGSPFFVVMLVPVVSNPITDSHETWPKFTRQLIVHATK